MMRTKWIAVITAGMIAAVALTGCGSVAADQSSGALTGAETGSAAMEAGAESSAADNTVSNGDETITVSGTGTVTVTPDIAQISLGVQTFAASTKTAQAENTKTVNGVIEVLENAGVEEKNIATSGLDIYANYDYSESGSGTLTGYTVTTTLRVSNLNVSDVGNLIDVATDAGVNQVNGISYSYSDSVTAYDQAIEAALDRASEKAQKIADKEGKTLAGIRTIQENGATYDSPVDSGQYASAEDSSGSSMNVLAGEADVTATVTVTYYFD